MMKNDMLVLKNMKEEIQKIKSDRIFNKFLCDIRIVDNGSLPLQYYIGDSLIMFFRKTQKFYK